MKEHPILFSAPMVHAILEGRKTQTRRIVKPQPGQSATKAICVNGWWMWAPERRHFDGRMDDLISDKRCPYGEPGDWLWVREKHCFLDVMKSKVSGMSLGPQNDNARVPSTWCLDIEYSDGTEHSATVEGEQPKQTRQRGECRWRPGIHMPRWASRITLEVTGVRVERLQEISEQDAREEGCQNPPTFQGVLSNGKNWYMRLWDEINGKRTPWASNPWVWVIEFKGLPCKP